MAAESARRIRGAGSPSHHPARSVSQRAATSRLRLPSSSRPTSSSTRSARRSEAAPMSSPISPATSFAFAPTSPCRCRGSISSATRDANVEARYCYNGPAFRFQPKGASGRIRASSARPASNASASPTATAPMSKSCCSRPMRCASAGLKAVPPPLRRHRAVLCAARCARCPSAGG